MCWVLIRKKSQFPKIFMNFVHFVENQFSFKVKTIRTDNAMELTKGEALNFYLAHGIKQQTSCIDTPQQNGVVERKQKHIRNSKMSVLPIKSPYAILGELYSVCSTLDKQNATNSSRRNDSI